MAKRRKLENQIGKTYANVHYERWETSLQSKTFLSLQIPYLMECTWLMTLRLVVILSLQRPWRDCQNFIGDTRRVMFCIIHMDVLFVSKKDNNQKKIADPVSLEVPE